MAVTTSKGSQRRTGGTIRQGRMREPKPPFPKQHQPRPGIESKMNPRPRYTNPDYKAAGKLKGKYALITGGDSGIGRAVAHLYAREGAGVAIVYLAEEQSDAEETRASIEKLGGECLLIPGDVRDPDFCKEAVDKTVERFGRLNILVNNAAYEDDRPSLEEIPLEGLRRTIETNLFGYIFMARAALPHLRGGDCIINCGSITGLEGHGELIDYAATKGAIHALTKSLAKNLAPRGIRVNCVAPGPVWTPFIVSDKDAERARKHGKDTPFGRPAQPEEVAPAFVFFASEADSSYITGEVLTLLGGETRAA